MCDSWCASWCALGPLMRCCDRAVRILEPGFVALADGLILLVAYVYFTTVLGEVCPFGETV
jgi:hypothetical protein